MGPSSSKKVVAQKATTEAPHMHLPSILPPQVAEQIRNAQQKAALSGKNMASYITHKEWGLMIKQI